MRTIQISLPNSPDNFLLVEMCERLKAGQTVTMLFGGASMWPMINGNGDKIRLRPLDADEECKPGKVYLFFDGNHYIIHRLMRIKKGVHDFRGDNCFKHEYVHRDGVLAQLMTVIRPDGTEVDCEGDWWRKRSRKVVLRRSARNLIYRVASRKARRKWSVLYFVLLAVLMWAPLNGLGLPLNNYVFGLRLDHLLHGLVFIPCAFFLMDWLRRRQWTVLGVAILIGLITEFGQYLLPFRGFDVNDLIANFGGSFLGWLAILPFMLRRPFKQ
ncbi:MAG: VanZ family protein [Bacteroidales bacterium]|nr:VanZ family protein [Bacteroidales bacterium]